MKSAGLLLVILVAIFGYTQAPDTLWTKTYGGIGMDYGHSVQQTNDGGYIIAGEIDGEASIIRTDSFGTSLWTKIYGAGGALSIQSTTDGGYIVGGYKLTQWDSWCWMLKLDEDGDSSWAIVLDYQGYACDIKQTADGGYIMTGAAYSPHWCANAFLIKTNSTGDTVWIEGGPDGGGASVQQTNDGGYISVGCCTPFMMMEEYFYLWKTDTLGNPGWYRQYSDTVPPSYSEGHGVLETADGHFIACGMIEGSYALLQTDSNGDTLWTKSYDFAGYLHGDAFSLIKTSDNRYLTVGCMDVVNWFKDAVFLKTDSLGNIEWSTILGDSLSDCGFESVQQTSDNGYIAVGYTDASGAGGTDVWLVKLGPDVGVMEDNRISIETTGSVTTIFRGPLQLPEGKKCRVFDITGRVVEPDKIQPGIYFTEVDGVVTQKVVKVR